MLGRLILAFINLWLFVLNSWRRLLRRHVDYVYLSLSGELPEFTPRPPLAQRLLGTRLPLSMEQLRARLQRIAADPRVRGVVLVLRDIGAGWATLQSLRDEMARLRAAGKRVVVYLPGAETRTYFAACAADEVLMPETARLNLLGLLTEAVFLRDALHMVGLEAEVTAVSPYKSGGDRFARADISPESREQLERLFDRRYEMLLAAMTTDRGLDDSAAARTLIDGAPYSAPEAHRLNLIDGVCYEDELAARLAQHAGVEKIRLRHWRAARRMLRLPYRRYQRRVVAALSLEGAIMSGRSRVVPLPLPLFGGRQVGSESVAQALRRIERDDRIAALVLHVNSPGGDSFASDLIWREVQRVRQIKPVVVSMGDVAASGGYYVAACASTIFAQPATLTGSIGVFALRPVVAGLLERLNVNTAVFSRGARAGLQAASLTPTDDEREVFRRLVFESYDTFKQRVRSGRDMSDEQLEPVAGGRVWMGTEAQQVRLIDELGGLPAAIARARSLAELPADPTARVLWVAHSRQDSHLLPRPFPSDALLPDAATLAALREHLLQPRVLAALPWDLRG
jgi:protease-4